VGATLPRANLPKDAQVLDLHGYSVIPGLVGMHDHMFYPMGNGIFGEMGYSFPRLYLAGGVTTIRTDWFARALHRPRTQEDQLTRAKHQGRRCM